MIISCINCKRYINPFNEPVTLIQTITHPSGYSYKKSLIPYCCWTKRSIFYVYCRKLFSIDESNVLDKVKLIC